MQKQDFTFSKANKGLFAVYQTIYSQADKEMWYDWNERLNDTIEWGDDCYFLYCNGDKIGGAIIEQNRIAYPFLVSPFCDRRLFWSLLLKHIKSLGGEDEIRLVGMLSLDVPVLLSMGAEIWRPRQIMCRPTDKLPYMLDDNFYLENPDENDFPEMADVILKSFAGGIDFRIFGSDDSPDDVIKDIKRRFTNATVTNSWKLTNVVKRKDTGSIAGGCIVGIHPEMVNKIAYLTDLFVLPEHRGKGLAEAMLRHAITTAHEITPAIKLHVLIGNASENLYRKTGFIPGPSFTDMKYRLTAQK